MNTPTTINSCLIAISSRARRTIKNASAVVTYTSTTRNPLTSPCRVQVVEMSGSGYTASIRRVVWSGPVAEGADAAGVAAHRKVFAQ